MMQKMISLMNRRQRNDECNAPFVQNIMLVNAGIRTRESLKDKDKTKLPTNHISKLACSPDTEFGFQVSGKFPCKFLGVELFLECGLLLVEMK
jgi:hypothetical protein